MNLSTRQSGSATIVDVEGDVTLYNSPELRALLVGLLKEKKSPRVIINLTNVKYIDSAGVASLVEGLKLSRELKTGFALFGLQRSPRQVLELTHLVKVFAIFETEPEAIAGSASASPSQ
ncbi:MAG: STAS domain-containing protein [Candidatus Acidiferrales bacterium]